MRCPFCLAIWGCPCQSCLIPREVIDLGIQAIWRCPNFGCLVTETWSCSQQSRKATGFDASLRSVLISNPGPMGVVVDLTSQAPPLRRCAIRFMEVIYQRSIRQLASPAASTHWLPPDPCTRTTENEDDTISSAKLPRSLLQTLVFMRQNPFTPSSATVSSCKLVLMVLTAASSRTGHNLQTG